jgi:hypothetical protein
MITPGEIAAMNRALASYEAFALRLRAVADDASFFSILGTSGRMSQVADEAAANVPRFYARRAELVEADPTDHEAVLAFCEGIADATGTRLVEAMAAEVQATDPARFVAAVARDTGTTLTSGLAFGGTTLLLLAGLYLALTLTRRD